MLPTQLYYFKNHINIIFPHTPSFTKWSLLFRFPVGIYGNWVAYNAYSISVIDVSTAPMRTPTVQNFYLFRSACYVKKVVFSFGSTHTTLHQNGCLSSTCTLMSANNLWRIIDIVGRVREWVVNLLLQLLCSLHTHSQIHTATSKLTCIARMSSERPPFCITPWLMGKELKFLIATNAIC